MKGEIQARKLRWRIMRGRQWLDLHEEVDEDGVFAYVGLIDGRVASRGDCTARAGAGLIRAALAAPVGSAAGGLVTGG